MGVRELEHPLPEVRPQSDRLLSVREVASLTGLAVGTIYHLISQKRIPVVRLSRRCVRVRLSDLLNWWDQMTENSRSPATQVDSN